MIQYIVWLFGDNDKNTVSRYHPVIALLSLLQLPRQCLQLHFTVIIVILQCSLLPITTFEMTTEQLLHDPGYQLVGHLTILIIPHKPEFRVSTSLGGQRRLDSGQVSGANFVIGSLFHQNTMQTSTLHNKY